MARLRSNFPVGGTPWAMRRAQWTALGLSEEDMDKPKIAIVNSSSKLASCFSHLDDVVPPLMAAVRAAGGVPFEVRTAAPSDAITSAGAQGRYILPSRDLIASDIEVAVEGAQLDGMVTLASCDKTTPGQLMAAGRLDVPTIVVGCGYQPSGVYRGEHVDFEDVFLYAGHVATGAMTVEELAEMASVAVSGPGVCAGMGTANSMHIATEALGMAMPGSTPVLALSDKMFADAERAGRRIVELVREDLRPRQVLTPGAFRNAVTAVLAISGSVNCVKHLQAIAVEAGCDVDVMGLFEELAPQVPLLTAVKPNGDRRIDEFEAAGGAQALLYQLRPLLDLDQPTVDGRTLGEVLGGATVADPDVIRPVGEPLATHPGITVVRGTLAPEGAVVKRTVADDGVHRFSGPAKVYTSREEGLAGIRAGEVRPGDVVVLSGLGLRGSPGMALTSAFVFALDGAGLGDQVVVVTDGQMSGLVNKGLVVAEVSPEGAVGGPLGLVRDGDVVSVDVDARTLDLQVPDEELERRRAELPPLPAPRGCGWLDVYARTVSPLGRGATLGG
ncbi:dihydroxy-acid dehydratase [Geodermatophilus sp. SYSU D00079]